MRGRCAENAGLPGLTLMEVVMALAVIGFAMPLVLAAMTASVKARKGAETDTLATLICRTVVEDLKFSRREAGMIFKPVADDVHPRRPVAADFPEGPDPAPITLGFDRSGRFVRALEADEYPAGVADPGIRYVVRVEGEPGEGDPGMALHHLRVEVEEPAAAPRQARNQDAYEYRTWLGDGD